MNPSNTQEMFPLDRARPLTLAEVLKLRDGLRIDRGIHKLPHSPGYFFYRELAVFLGKERTILSLN